MSLEGIVGVETLLPLSHLTSITILYIRGCRDLRGEGLLSLPAKGHLIEIVNEIPNSRVVSLPPKTIDTLD